MKTNSITLFNTIVLYLSVFVYNGSILLGILNFALSNNSFLKTPFQNTVKSKQLCNIIRPIVANRQRSLRLHGRSYRSFTSEEQPKRYPIESSRQWSGIGHRLGQWFSSEKEESNSKHLTSFYNDKIINLVADKVVAERSPTSLEVSNLYCDVTSSTFFISFSCKMDNRN